MYIYPQNAGLQASGSPSYQQLMLLNSIASRQQVPLPQITIGNPDQWPPDFGAPPAAAAPSGSALTNVVNRLMASVDYLVTVASDLARQVLGFFGMQGPPSGVGGFPPQGYPNLVDPSGNSLGILYGSDTRQSSGIDPGIFYGQPEGTYLQQPMPGAVPTWGNAVSDAALNVGMGMAFGGAGRAALTGGRYLTGSFLPLFTKASGAAKSGASWLGSAASKLWSGAKDVFGKVYEGAKGVFGKLVGSFF